ncbi:MAG: bifunctional phosphoribosylaminoimidazolecarboxamide formyltransferase/IMP cyclohydrolase [Candidatus Thermoplasmatota archaeon]|nr:bifunctional phosphoribosylaminoimidazolecarboxamide formyltransferase/IMP cyclohydrolase [Candidatus Thermoplasmatota archaeon]
MASPRALLSVWEKYGIESLGESLVDMGWELLSTGGTATALRKAGLKVTEVTEITGHPEILGGRVKTLHPAVHGGILARRDKADDIDTLIKLGYGTIDLVCINLYPFERTAARDPPASDGELIEMIDIGGPTVIRSAAKNHSDVIVLTHPDQYNAVLDSLAGVDGNPSGVDQSARQALALAAFQRTAAYDAVVSNELESRFGKKEIPSRIYISSGSAKELRYGENPHQPAAFYPAADTPSGLAVAVQHGGKPLSYNNYLDLDAALRLTRSLCVTCPDEPHACVVIKHTNPCGVAVDQTQEGAWENALASDPESAFGCVIAFTKPVEKTTAEAIDGHFLECMIAPSYEPEALEILSTKKNRRLLTLNPIEQRVDELSLRQIDGGWLGQLQGPPRIDWDEARCVTKKQINAPDLALARFGTTVLSEVKSNAIVLVRRNGTGCATVGIGPGQTSRIESVRIAARRATEKANGSLMASDAFFPFRDAIDAAHEMGVATVVQPGGSVRDQESIDAANEHGMAMLFTGTRLFLH